MGKTRSSDEDGSVTNLIAALRAGRGDAPARLWDRYFNRLVLLARRRLQSMPQLTGDDEEDAALSAIRSVCAGVSNGKFPDVTDRDDLWRLLTSLTANKLKSTITHERRLKRGAGRVVSETDMEEGTRGLHRASNLSEIPDHGPAPDIAVLMAEACRQLLEALGDEALERIAIEKMEGYTDEQIAERRGVSRRTIVRKIAIIRKCWIEAGST